MSDQWDYNDLLDAHARAEEIVTQEAERLDTVSRETLPDCDCEMCRTTRQLQGLVEGISLSPMGMLISPSPQWTEVDVSNSGDLDDSYNKRG